VSDRHRVAVLLDRQRGCLCSWLCYLTDREAGCVPGCATRQTEAGCATRQTERGWLCYLTDRQRLAVLPDRQREAGGAT